MPTQPPLPPILIPYVSPPPRSSLTLVTSVIGATSNWLVLRFLLATLSSGSSRAETAPLDGNGDDGVKGGRRKVVLLSFLRNWEFWKSEAKRLVRHPSIDAYHHHSFIQEIFGVLVAATVAWAFLANEVCDATQGLDLARLSEQGRFAFIDGLSELFYSSSSSTSPSPSLSQSGSSVPPPSLGRTTTLPVRSPPGTVPARVPGTTTPATAGSSSSLNRASTASESTIKRLRFTGRGTAALDALEKDVLAVVEELQTKGRTAASPDGGSGGDDDENGVVLVIDQPDLLLAATGPSQGIGATEMGEWIMGLEQVRQATSHI